MRNGVLLAADLAEEGMNQIYGSGGTGRIYPSAGRSDIVEAGQEFADNVSDFVDVSESAANAVRYYRQQ